MIQLVAVLWYRARGWAGLIAAVLIDRPGLLFGVVGILLGLLWAGVWDTRAAAASWLMGVLGLVFDASREGREGRHFGATFRDSVPQSLTLSKNYTGWVPLESNGAQLFIWTHPELNTKMRTTPVALEIRQSMFRLPDQVLPNRIRLLRAQFKRHGVAFNGKKIRLTSDLTIDSLAKAAKIQPTSYFRSLCTNDAMALTLRRDGDVVFDGLDLVRHDGHIRDLAEHELSNHLGGSTLAFTDDRYIVVVYQGRDAYKNPGRKAPSGSGSLDWRDRKPQPTSLQELVVRGIERELLEELGLPQSTGVRSVLTGFARDLSRGGQPQFYAFSFVDAEFRQVRTRFREGPYVRYHDHSFIESWDPEVVCHEVRRLLVSHDSAVSMPLEAAVELFVAAIEEDPSLLDSARSHHSNRSG